MTATDRRAAALADLSREFVAAFGESLPYDSFATQRKEGEEWETGGRYYKRQGGKTVRVKNPKAGEPAGSPGSPTWKKSLGGGEPKPAATPEPSPAAPAPSGPTARRTRGGVGVKINPYQKPRPLAAGDLVPAGMAQAPPPTPAESAKLDAHEKADSGRWGSRAARVIRRVTEAVRGLFTLGGLVTGAGLGAKVGGVVAGPLGVALGTAIGGGLGGLIGKWGGSRVGRRSGVGMARATRPANRMAEAFAEPLPPDAVATIKARLKELAAAGGYQIPDVPDDVILKAIEMATRDEDAAGVGAAGAAMAGAADAFEEAAGGRRCRGKRLNKFRAAPFKMPYTPMPSYKPRGGVGMF